MKYKGSFTNGICDDGECRLSNKIHSLISSILGIFYHDNG